MMQNLNFFIALLTGILFLSCHKIERKGRRMAGKAINTVAELKDSVNRQVDKWVDSKFPSFDSYTADTEHNKRRFKNYLEVPVTEDVKNIYTMGDFLGIDYKVLIGFSCSPGTAKRIITVKKMAAGEKGDRGLNFSAELPWWDEKAIEQLQPYRKGEEGKYWEYFWYDTASGRAWYLEFSL